jgi:hypothetical protein
MTTAPSYAEETVQAEAEGEQPEVPATAGGGTSAARAEAEGGSTEPPDVQAEESPSGSHPEGDSVQAEAGAADTAELPAAEERGERITLPERARTSARKWVAEAAASGAIGGGPDGLAAHLRNPHPAPLRTHFGHLDRARAELFRKDNDARLGAARKAAFHLLIAIPVKVLAKAMKVTGKTLAHSGEVLDWAADSPYMIIPMGVLIAVLVTVLWLLG